MDLTINSRLVIPSKELQWRFSRASGPGGQGVNTTDSRVELVFDLKASSSIGHFHKQQLINQLGSRLVVGCLRVVASEERSQFRNRQVALSRMADILREGLKPLPRARKPTKPNHAAQRRRLERKKQRSQLKRKRQIKSSIDD